MAADPGVSAQAPAFEPFFVKSEPDDRSSNAYRQLIGGLGFVLPIALWLVAGLRPTSGLTPWGLLTSLSAYYYTGAVAAFVGLLVALGIFLFTYQGYRNEYSRKDRRASMIAGTAAVLVASFPAAAPIPSLAPSWWTTSTGLIHYSAAAVLFCSFSYFSLFLFTKSNPAQVNPLSPGKRSRNRIYRVCGVLILLCVAWAGIASFMDAPIFVPEALALEFFALSWLTKGRFDRTAATIAKRTRSLVAK